MMDVLYQSLGKKKPPEFSMPIPSKKVAAEVSPRAPSVRRPLLTRAARRDIRRASALANELKAHSFRVHVDGTITWTLRHEDPKKSVPAKLNTSEADVSKTETSMRKQKSTQRATAHRALMSRAQAFYARVLVQIVPARRDTAQPEFLWSVRAPASQFLISAKKLSQNPALSF